MQSWEPLKLPGSRIFCLSEFGENSRTAVYDLDSLNWFDCQSEKEFNIARRDVR